MTTLSPPRRRVAALFAVGAVVAGSATLTSPASALPGAAPAPSEYRVLQDLHTDAVSTFLDEGTLTLDTKADVPEGNGTRLAAESVWFNLDDDSQVTLPAGYEFIAPSGSTAWIAPQSSPGPTQLWPGFSTESIPLGAIDGDSTTFTLLGVDGPGDIELFSTGSFGGVTRIWSSDEPDLNTLTVGRVHMHANWAFTAAGSYDITVQAAVSIGGVQQTDTATYTFVVGALPEQVATTTALGLSASEIAVGDPLTATATISPSGVEGWVEFRQGETLLGHEAVVDGNAALPLSPAVGSHSITAAFVPAVANVASASTSEPAPVVVTDGSGVEFGVAGIASTYAPGATLNARVAGHVLDEAEIYRWVWRQTGTTSAYVLTGGGQEAAGRLTLPVDMSHNGYEVSVQVRQGGTTVTQSPWVPIHVGSEVQPLTPTFPADTMYLGDELFVELDGPLAEGDSLRLAQRGTAGPWYAFTKFTQIDADTFQLTPDWQATGVSWAIQTVRDGVVVAQSAPVAKDVNLREVHVEGIQSVYRVGQTLSATGRVFPDIEGLTHRWALARSLPEAPYWEETVLKEGSTEADLTVELPIEASHDGWTLYFWSSLPEGHPSGATQVTSFQQVLNVSDSSADTQLLFFEALGAHYHQGYEVNLNLIADPALADGDTVAWQWMWPGTDEWVTLPGASGASHQLVAEQALDGVEVRAVLSFAGGGDEIIGETATIFVDDHGSPARQKVAVTGAGVSDGGLTATDGDSVTVAAEVEHGTVLDSFQWFLKLPGAAEAAPIEGATSAAFEFVADIENDGAELSVAVVMPNGSLAYGPSAPVVTTVTAAEEPIATTVTVTGLEESYEVGDTMTLVATQDPETGEDHWHWFLRAAGATEYTVIAGQGTSTLTRTIGAGDDGASIVARLYDHDHGVIAESSPVVVTVDDHDGEVPPTTGKPTTAPSDKTGDDLGSTPAGGIELSKSTVQQGQTLTVDAGEAHSGEWLAAWLFSEPALLGGDWVQANAEGKFAVTIALDATPGEHRLAVFDADGELLGWAAVTVTAAPGSGIGLAAGLAGTGAGIMPLWFALPLLAAGTLLLLRRRGKTA